MMTNPRVLWAVVALALGCDDGASDANRGARDAEARILADAARDDAGPQPTDAAPGDDASPRGDAGPDGDAAPTRDAAPAVGDCAAACDRYAACEHLIDVFGDEQACLDACHRASRDEPPRDWFRCVEGAACDDLPRCEVPGPDALPCEEVCAAATECGFEGPPCDAGCEAAPAGLSGCGEHLVSGACDLDAFRRCLGEAVYPACDQRCRGAVACNLVDEPVCYADCIATLHGDDPLARRRMEQSGPCVQAAADQCFNVVACVDPGAGGGLGHTCQQACEGFQTCGIVADADLPACLDQCAGSLAEDPVGHQLTIDCVVEFFVTRDCQPDALFECMNLQPPQRDPPCVALCEGRTLCGIDERPQAACVQACDAARADPLQAESVRASLRCGQATSCPDLEACLAETDPVPICAAHCDALDACALAAGTCPGDCVARFGRARERAARTCVAESPDCDAVAACAPRPPPPCGDYCARLLACQAGGEDVLSCERQCDDDAFADASGVEQRIGCVLSAPECASENPFEPGHTVSACSLDSAVGGDAARACLNYCRALTECGEGGGLSACAQACGAGLGGEDALRYFQAAPCLLAAEPEASCEALLACVPAEVLVDCDARCAAPLGCGIEEVECDCEDREVAGCVLAASVRGDGCAAIAACVGFEPPAPDPSCAAVCAAQVACDQADDPLRCQLACEPAPIAAACVEEAPCDAIAACLALPAEPAAACVEACAATECAGEDCAARCTGRAANPRAPADYLPRLPGCVADAADCDAVEACFRVATLCEIACGLLIECQIGLAMGEPADCVAFFCPNGPPEPIWAQSMQCAADVLGGGACDEEAYLACAAGQPPPP